VARALADKLNTTPQELGKAIDRLVTERQSAQKEAEKARQDAEDQRARADAANDRARKADDRVAAIQKKADEEVAALRERSQADADEINRLRTEADTARRRAEKEIAAAREEARAKVEAAPRNQQESGTRAEESTGANPLEADRHYAAGLNLYFARRYDAAEREFQAALNNDNQDARFYYFLGLSRLAQGRPDAYGDFDQGARLEKRGLPPRAAVSTSLERVQGPVRQTLNSVRDRAQ